MPVQDMLASFSTEHDSAFLPAEPRTKTTGIFIDRFFHRMSFADLAVKYETTPGGVARFYDNARQRILKTVQAMDREKIALSNGAPLAVMPKAVRAFFLHTVFLLPVTEIAQLTGVSSSLVTRQIQQTRDRILTGEIDLVEYVPGASERLTSASAKRKAYDAAR